MRMRVAARPGIERAGGWISAGMISTVQMPLPMRAAIEPSDWPQLLRALARVAEDLDDGLAL
jgi:hypothetical protein